MKVLLVAAALWASPVWAADPPNRPAPAEAPVMLAKTLTGQVGRIVVLEAGGKGKSVRWRLEGDRAAADLIPIPGSKRAHFATPTPGRYVVFAWSAAGDEPSAEAECVVLIDAPEPPPVPDATLEALKAAYAKDSAGQQAAEQLRLLLAVWRAAPQDCRDAALTTAGQLLDRLKARRNAVLPESALPALRRQLADLLNDALPREPDAALTPETREKAAAAFARLTSALEKLP